MNAAALIIVEVRHGATRAYGLINDVFSVVPRCSYDNLKEFYISRMEI